MKKIFNSIFGNPTMDCFEEIRQLIADENLTSEHLNFIRNKYPNELHSWKFDERVTKIVMYNL